MLKTGVKVELDPRQTYVLGKFNSFQIFSEITANLVFDEIDQELSKPGSGRAYRKKGRTHYASAPGQSPTSDTGELKSSISVEPLKKGTSIDAGSVRLIIDSPYAQLLENGTSRILARPFIKPALDYVLSYQLDTIINKTLNDAFTLGQLPKYDRQRRRARQRRRNRASRRRP